MSKNLVIVESPAKVIWHVFTFEYAFHGVEFFVSFAR